MSVVRERKGRRKGDDSGARTFGGVEVHLVETFKSPSTGFHDYRHVIDSIADQLVLHRAGRYLQFDVIVSNA